MSDKGKKGKLKPHFFVSFREIFKYEKTLSFSRKRSEYEMKRIQKFCEMRINFHNDIKSLNLSLIELLLENVDFSGTLPLTRYLHIFKNPEREYEMKTLRSNQMDKIFYGLRYRNCHAQKGKGTLVKTFKLDAASIIYEKVLDKNGKKTQKTVTLYQNFQQNKFKHYLIAINQIDKKRKRLSKNEDLKYMTIFFNHKTSENELVRYFNMEKFKVSIDQLVQ